MYYTYLYIYIYSNTFISISKWFAFLHPKMILPPYTVIEASLSQQNNNPEHLVYCVRVTSLIPTCFSTTCAEGEGALEEGVEADALAGS